MSAPDLPPKPKARGEKVNLRQYVRLFRKDILSAQPARLYRAWMAEFRTPFFRSYLINQPELVKKILKERPDDFPKSGRVSEGLRPLLGDGVFLTNGEIWKRQRRIIDPAFEGGRLRETFPSMWAAAENAVKRLGPLAGSEVEFERQTSHVTADVIFRTLFSIPIENEIAAEMFEEFHRYQRSQPLLNIAAILPLPRWMPRFFRSATKGSAAKIRAAISKLTLERSAAIAAGTAPDDLVTKIMTTTDPVTGERFTPEEMVDQVSIFFLAGHETSASALAWALYLLAQFPDWQEQVAREAEEGLENSFSAISKLRLSRDVFREALRLYPPVPMMVRQSTCPEEFREREIKVGSQVVLSAWHLHRHERLWENPDGFDPARWGTENGKTCMRDAYIPFSAGSRVCPGAGFATIEGTLILSMIMKHYRVSLTDRAAPEPVAHLTVRSKDGIFLRLERR